MLYVFEWYLCHFLLTFLWVEILYLLFLSQQFEGGYRCLNDFVDKIHQKSPKVTLFDVFFKNELTLFKKLHCQKVHIVNFCIFAREYFRIIYLKVLVPSHEREFSVYFLSAQRNIQSINQNVLAKLMLCCNLLLHQSSPLFKLFPLMVIRKNSLLSFCL